MEPRENQIQGQLVQGEFGERRLWIYLPPDYSVESSPFPVIYLQDSEVFLKTYAQSGLWELEQGILTGTHRGMLFVGLDPKERLDEYTPWFAKALTPRFKDFGGQGDQFLSLVVEELKPYIDNHYHTLQGPQGTALMGASLGGMISLYGASKYPEVFGKVGSLSASLWYEGFMDYMEALPKLPRGMKVYLDVGTLEGVGKESVQVMMVPNTLRLYQMLKEKAWSEDQVKLVLEEGAHHHQQFFTRRLPGAVRWLFSQELHIDHPCKG